MEQNKQLDEVVELLQSFVKDREEHDKLHKEEHDYLRVLIEEHQVRKETWLVIKRRVASGTIWSLLVGLVSAVVFTVKAWLGTAP